MKGLRGLGRLAVAAGVASVVVLGVAPAALATTADTTAPSAPSNLTAARAGITSDVYVDWTASTDDVGVAHYEVSIDGAAPVTTATDAYTHVGGYQANHTYSVVAVDTSGNKSAAASVTYNASTGLATSDLTSGKGSEFFTKITAYFREHVTVAVLALFALTVGVGVLMGWGRKAAKST